MSNTKQKITKPGIYKDVDIEVYHNSPGLSSSGVRPILKAPRQYYYEFLTDEGKRKDTQAMKVGRALHCLTLEPKKFEDYFCFARKDILRKDIEEKNPTLKKKEIDVLWAGEKAAREQYVKDNAHKDMLSEDDYEKVKRMAWSVRAHPLFKKITAKGGYVEHSIMWEDKETGALLRTRPDFFNEKYILDLKSTDDASPDAFSRSMFKYGYHHQNAMNCDGVTAQTGRVYEDVVLFAVENKAPYLCRPYLVKGNAVEQGRSEYKKAAATYKKCIETNHWEGYPRQIVEIDLPQWAYKA